MQTFLKITIIFGHIFLFSKSYSRTQVIIYADESYQPYSYIENEKPAGLYYEILKKIFSKMQNYSIKIETRPWKRGLDEVEKGSAFAIYPPYYRRQERPWMAYSQKILDEKLVMYCKGKKDLLEKRLWPSDYQGFIIGINTGFSMPFFVTEAESKGFIKIEEAKETKQNIKKMIAGRIHCYINDDLGIKVELEKLKKQGEYKPNSPENEFVKVRDLSSEAGYLGYLKAKDKKYPFKDQFFQEFNSLLKQMHTEREIEKIKDDFIKNNFP
jgi:polar amino acid transport system substrate-binding protein